MTKPHLCLELKLWTQVSSLVKIIVPFLKNDFMMASSVLLTHLSQPKENVS